MPRKPTKVPVRTPSKKEKKVPKKPRRPRKSLSRRDSSDESFDFSPPSEEAIDEIAFAAEANLIGRINREGKLY